MLTTKRLKYNFKGYETMKTKLENLIYTLLLAGFSLLSSAVYAISLDDVSFASLPGERVQIKGTSKNTLFLPLVFEPI